MFLLVAYLPWLALFSGFSFTVIALTYGRHVAGVLMVLLGCWLLWDGFLVLLLCHVCCLRVWWTVVAGVEVLFATVGVVVSRLSTSIHWRTVMTFAIC